MSDKLYAQQHSNCFIKRLPQGLNISTSGTGPELDSMKNTSQHHTATMISLDLGTAHGVYQGSVERLFWKKSGCLCCGRKKIYQLCSDGTGKFSGKIEVEGLSLNCTSVQKMQYNISYEGEFGNSLFDTSIGKKPARFCIEKFMKYEGGFRTGFRHGPGTQWGFDVVGNKYFKVFQGRWKVGKPWNGQKFRTFNTYMEVVDGKDSVAKAVGGQKQPDEFEK
jgi:hypothetical protein